MGRITVVNLVNENVNKQELIEYDLDEKRFIFGSRDDHRIYDEKGDYTYDYSDDMNKAIVNKYSIGCTATGNTYIVYDGEPNRLYYIPADKSQPPEMIFDANKPNEIQPKFLRNSIQ